MGWKIKEYCALSGDPRVFGCSELLSHIQNTNSQYNLPDFGKKLAYKTIRIGAEEHFEDPSVRKNIQLDLALLDTYDQELTKVENFINKNAKIHDLSTYLPFFILPWYITF